MDEVRQSEAVHIARHIDICEYQADVGARIDQNQGLGDIAGFEDIVASVSQHIACHHPDKKLIFDDEHYDQGRVRISAEGIIFIICPRHAQPPSRIQRYALRYLEKSGCQTNALRLLWLRVAMPDGARP